MEIILLKEREAEGFIVKTIAVKGYEHATSDVYTRMGKAINEVLPKREDILFIVFVGNVLSLNGTSLYLQGRNLHFSTFDRGTRNGIDVSFETLK